MYGKGLGKGGCCPMSFAEFVDKVAEEEARPTPHWRYYLQAPLVWNADDSTSHNAMLQKAEANDAHDAPPRPQVTDPQAPGLAFAPLAATVRSDLKRLIDWKWLATARQTSRCPTFDSATLWAGYGGGATPLHIDHVSNFFAQLAGRKRLLLFPPSLSFHLYPHAVHHPAGKDFASVDVEKPDLERFPAFARARGIEVEMQPGEVLFLPDRWWHYVRQLDPGHENLSLNFWVQGESATTARIEQTLTDPSKMPSPQEAADEALLAADEAEALLMVHLAVMIEGAALDYLGLEESGRFLNGLAAGADAAGGEWAAGPQMARYAASELRSQMLALVGSERANALLRLMTRDGRLHPGLAPAVSGPLVNSEAGQHTPPNEMARMRAIAAGAPNAGRSPFL